MGFFDAVNFLPMMAAKGFFAGFIICLCANLICKILNWPVLANVAIVALTLLLLLSPQIKALYFDVRPEYGGDSMTTAGALWTIVKVKFWAAVVGYGFGAFLYAKYVD
ncbi:hypothetical protein [Janthinobacterium sp. MDT1-19]|uniref:hypothetical protein n=1 Tax=Janthinobacterium sp. MDT1-19 TaxID=1259339 RepID=UPI003F25F156